MVKVYNMMEELVEQEVREVMEKFPQACRCEQCIGDIVAIALNNLPPRYVSSEKGTVMVRIMSTTDREKINLIREVTAAVEKVVSNPHHPGFPDVLAHTKIMIQREDAE